jgi:hypothetical protein
VIRVSLDSLHNPLDLCLIHSISTHTVGELADGDGDT